MIFSLGNQSCSWNTLYVAIIEINEQDKDELKVWSELSVQKKSKSRIKVCGNGRIQLVA